MSIPERLYRIAKFKLGELKDRLDDLDTDALEAEQKRAPSPPKRPDARRELEEALGESSGSTAPTSAVRPDLGSPVGTRRTPEEIARGARPGSGTGALSGANTPLGTTIPAANAASATGGDPLAYHYKLLGVEAESEFSTVQAAYKKLAARCDPGRFPAGSQDERTAQEIRTRLEASYKVLRDALDPTARRFDLLEFDAPSAPRPDTDRKP